MMDYLSSSSDEDEILINCWDISRDDAYQLKPVLERRSSVSSRQSAPKHRFELPQYGLETVKHSLPAYDLWRPFFPTYLSAENIRNFHRPQLRHYKSGPQALKHKDRKKRPFVPMKNLTRHIYRNQLSLLSKVEQAIDTGLTKKKITESMLRIKLANHLSAKDGEIFLFEYSEEFPPVLGQVGMSSNIKNYIAPLSGTPQGSTKVNKQKDPLDPQNNGTLPANNGTQYKMSKRQDDNDFGFPEEYLKEPSSLYFTPLKPGSKVQFIENNLYRAPIFRHSIPSCDFLVIRTRNSMYVRSIKTIFTVGQTLPLKELPSPSERNYQKFRLDFSNLYAHKLFRASEDKPPSIRIENLHKLFPDYVKKTLRKRLISRGVQSCSTGTYISGTSHYGKLNWKALCEIMTPEKYCMYMAAMVARDRLRDLHYTETMIFNTNMKEIETEVLAAPWNTSKAVVDMMKGRCYLDLKNHLIDPTGRQREGFSCVSWSRSPTEDQQAEELRSSAMRKPTPMGQANNVAPSRGRSGTQARPFAFGKNPLLNKIRGEKLERLAIYRREAQLIAETQSKVLSSVDPPTSSSEDEDDTNCDEDPTFAKQLHDLDRLLIGNKSIEELAHENEERERLKMLSDFNVGKSNGFSNSSSGPRTSSPNKSTGTNPVGSKMVGGNKFEGKVLKITRTHDWEDTQIQSTEIVREPKIIELYIKEREKLNQTVNCAENYGSSTSTKTSAAGATTNSVPSSQVSFTTSQRILLNESVVEVPAHGMSQSFSMPTESGGGGGDSSHLRSSKLAPGELCRADGIKIRISKKVLESSRKKRHERRTSLS